MWTAIGSRCCSVVSRWGRKHRVVTLEEHVAYAGHPEGLPAIGPTVASAGAGPWASTIRSSQDHRVQSPHLKAVDGAVAVPHGVVADGRPLNPVGSGHRRGGCGVLMPSTPFASSQVVSRTFASFRVVNSSVSAKHTHPAERRLAEDTIAGLSVRCDRLDVGSGQMAGRTARIRELHLGKVIGGRVRNLRMAWKMLTAVGISSGMRVSRKVRIAETSDDTVDSLSPPRRPDVTGCLAPCCPALRSEVPRTGTCDGHIRERRADATSGRRCRPNELVLSNHF
jgi:hypothetical protein